MGFFQEVQAQFGRVTTRNLKKWVGINIKLASARNRKIFLLQCRKWGILPRHITDNTRNMELLIETQDGRTGQEVHNFTNRLKNKVLNLEIKITHRNIDLLEKSQLELTEKIKGILPLQMWEEFERRQISKYNNHFHRIKSININKLNSLKNKYNNEIVTKNNWIKNYSDVDIPSEILIFLSLGHKFSVPPSTRDVSVVKLLADLEFLMTKTPNREKNRIRAQLTNIITNFLHKPHKSYSYINFLFNKCKSFLKNHQELIVTRADKGNVTVILSKQQYLDLSHLLLDDETYYKKINRDPTSTFEQRSNKIMSKFKKENKIDTNKNFTIYKSVAPRFYGLPKIHKPVLSLRPIISSIDSPNSKISSFITDVLTEAHNYDNPYYVKDSFQFAEFMQEKMLPPNFVLISLDVVSLFNNIPINLIKNSIQKNWTLISAFCNLTLHEFLSLVDFVFDTSYFLFDGTYYKQILGTPMGATVSPIFAEYVMDDLLEVCISQLDFQLPFLKKYVDDIICAVPADKIDQTMVIFNNYNPHLQFTVELENDRKIAFLDTELIRRNDNSVILNWYRKPTSSGRYLNYNSNHTHKMKINLMLGLKNRIRKIAHPSLHRENLNLLYNILLDNAYPAKLVKKYLFNTFNNGNTNRRDANADIMVPDNVLQNSIYGSVPYIKEITPKIIKVLKRENGVKIAQRNVKPLSLLYSKLKDKEITFNKSDVVYSIPCHNCDSKYIGQTCRNLKNRITSHKSDVRTGKRSSALSEHALDTGHIPDYANTSVLHTERNLTKRLFLEMVSINREPQSMNKRTDISNLSQIYNYILDVNITDIPT